MDRQRYRRLPRSSEPSSGRTSDRHRTGTSPSRCWVDNRSPPPPEPSRVASADQNRTEGMAEGSGARELTTDFSHLVREFDPNRAHVATSTPAHRSSDCQGWQWRPEAELVTGLARGCAPVPNRVPVLPWWVSLERSN